MQRVRVTSATILPDRLPEGGLLHLHRDSRTLSATLSDGGAARWQAWATEVGAECAVELLNLEELFIELHAASSPAARYEQQAAQQADTDQRGLR